MNGTGDGNDGQGHVYFNAMRVMTFVDSGLQRGTVYDYHIEAFNLAGYSDYTGVNTVTAASWGPPQAFFKYQRADPTKRMSLSSGSMAETTC